VNTYKQTQPKGFAIMQRYDLSTQYDSRASFYGKAYVENYGHKLVLTSYTTEVATIYPSEQRAEVTGTYSNTTLRHIKEFLKQNGFKAENSKQIMADYGVQS
jgi:hypothetical protein